MHREVTIDASRDAQARTVFWVLLWVVAAIAFGAHVVEADRGRIGLAAAILIALIVWLHGVHRIQSTRHLPQGRGQAGPESATSGRAIVMVAGLYLAHVGLLLVDSSYLLMLVGSYAVTYAFVTRPSRALACSAVLTAIWLWAWLWWNLPTGGIVTPVLVFGVLTAINHFTAQVAAQNAERGELLDELRRTRAQLAEAERDRGTLAERERLAGEIHDTLAQGFTSIVLVAEATRLRADDLPFETVEKHLDLIEETARSNLAEARRLVAGLRPVVLDGRSLSDALAATVDQFAARTGTTASFTGDTSLSLGGDGDVAVLRVVQEALANCEKHAGASAVAVNLAARDGEAVEVTVRDDGRGFREGEVSAVAGGSSGAGIALARRRIDALGGTLTIDSTPGAGTTVAVFVPRPARVGP